MWVPGILCHFLYRPAKFQSAMIVPTSRETPRTGIFFKLRNQNSVGWSSWHRCWKEIFLPSHLICVSKLKSQFLSLAIAFCYLVETYFKRILQLIQTWWKIAWLSKRSTHHRAFLEIEFLVVRQYPTKFRIMSLICSHIKSDLPVRAMTLRHRTRIRIMMRIMAVTRDTEPISVNMKAMIHKHEVKYNKHEVKYILLEWRERGFKGALIGDLSCNV
jgi:hypothetical protein